MSKRFNRPWTTLWDRPNRRVLLLAGDKPASRKFWGHIKHDAIASDPGAYNIWREKESEDVVFVEVQLDDKDTPLGFPHDLLDDGLLGSMTIWPWPGAASFIWWHSSGVDLKGDEIETKQQGKQRASALNASETIRADKARRRAAALKAWETRRAKGRVEKIRKVEDRLR